MTQLYSASSPLRRAKFLLFIFFACAVNVLQAQTYYVHLSGPNEVPPNSSAGTGKAMVTITGNMMRVQVSFSGLTGNTTASHIHAPTATAGAGTAGVATTTPTFTGFPLGVTSGTYDHTYDMTLNSSYNPSYITANGGTAASAFTAFKTAIAAGKSYLNIHTTFAPGGEIRGFLVACPSVMVSIPDAWALPQGTAANTVYPAYAPASSLTLQANVSGGASPYSYSWSNGVMTASTTVSPTMPTNYSVMVTDQNGCMGMASKMVNVVNVAGGNNGKNIVVCHKGQDIAVAAPAVPAHLGHGDMLGSCDGASHTGTVRESGLRQIGGELSARVLANPSTSYFDLQLTGTDGAAIQLKVYDLQGRVVESRPSLQANQSLRLGATYRPGVYLVQVIQGSQHQTIRLVKTN